MLNPSIYAAFERMWHHILIKLENLAASSFSGNYDELINKPVIPSVINNLTSDSSTDALSAAQGQALKKAMDGITTDLGDMGGGDMMKAVYDTDSDGIIDRAKSLNVEYLQDGTDINSLIKSGIYYLGNGNYGNSPYVYGYLEVMPIIEDHIEQRIFSGSNPIGGSGMCPPCYRTGTINTSETVQNITWSKWQYFEAKIAEKAYADGNGKNIANTYATINSFTQVSQNLNEHSKDVTIHVTSEEKQKWDAKSNFSGDYQDLTNAPSITEDENDLLVVDKNGNIVFRINADGLEATKFRTEELVVNGKQITGDGSGSTSTGGVLPECTTADNGKFLCVVNGVPTWVSIPNAEEASF